MLGIAIIGMCEYFNSSWAPDVTGLDGDTCEVSSPSGAAALAKRIGANATLIHVASTESVGPPCEAFAPHGFYGIENETIAKIAEWIR